MPRGEQSGQGCRFRRGLGGGQLRVLRRLPAAARSGGDSTFELRDSAEKTWKISLAAGGGGVDGFLRLLAMGKHNLANRVSLSGNAPSRWQSSHHGPKAQHT